MTAMELSSTFDHFLARIRPDGRLRGAYRSGLRSLRERLRGDPALGPHVLAVLLHGSHRRGTALRPRSGERDVVDLLVLTDHSPHRHSPASVLRAFTPCMRAHFDRRWQRQGRALLLRFDTHEFRVVVAAGGDGTPRTEDPGDALDDPDTTAPDDAAAWRQDALLIPDRQVSRWEQTHPLAQIAWTRAKNASCNGFFLDIVRTMQWWHRVHPELPAAVRGYRLERLVGDCCPDGVRGVASGVAATLEGLHDRYSWHARTGRTPFLAAPGVPERNVLAASTRAREAIACASEAEAHRRWRELLGPKFPSTDPTRSTT
jgi:hypothetical protein